ncbi:MAG: hypothetical protein Q9220_003891 [cf. Caloplaca sp. 1 TL-2023]
MANFARVRVLDIGVDVELDGFCSAGGMSKFLDTLTAMGCSFTLLKFLYRFPRTVTKELEALTEGFLQNTKLLDATCALDVQRGIRLRFSSRDAIAGITALYQQFARGIADRKSWLIEESCRELWSRPSAYNCTKISKSWILPRPSSAEKGSARQSLRDSGLIL